MKRSKILTTKLLYKDTHTTVSKLKIKKPNGTIQTRAQMKQRPFVIVVAIDSKKRVLLSKEFRVSLQKTVWGVPLKDGLNFSFCKKEKLFFIFSILDS